MSTITWSNRFELHSAADTALKFATRFWFVAAVIGQWAFLYYIVLFYGPSTFRGDFAAWSKNTFLTKGYIAGDTVGNLVFAVHALFAAITSFGGAIQLIPWVRKRALAVHRWNGRLFLLTALVVSVSGLYIEWIRGRRAVNPGSMAITLNALLIIVFAVLAWRSALHRDVSTHRRWALRTYLVANGQWFMRVGMIGWIIVERILSGTTKGLESPFYWFWIFGCYLVPLGVLELYLRASTAGPRARFAMAGALVVLTLFMSIGIFGVSMLFWKPLLEKL